MKQQTIVHDFHWLLVATKLLTTQLHSCYAKKAEILQRPESDVNLRFRNPVIKHWSRQPITISTIPHLESFCVEGSNERSYRGAL